MKQKQNVVYTQNKVRYSFQCLRCKTTVERDFNYITYKEQKEIPMKLSFFCPFRFCNEKFYMEYFIRLDKNTPEIKITKMTARDSLGSESIETFKYINPKT